MNHKIKVSQLREYDVIFCETREEDERIRELLFEAGATLISNSGDNKSYLLVDIFDEGSYYYVFKGKVGSGKYTAPDDLIFYNVINSKQIILKQNEQRTSIQKYSRRIIQYFRNAKEQLSLSKICGRK